MFSWLTDRLSGRNSGSKAYQTAEQIYAAIVAQARQPAFYSELGVADTVQGRFELISLNMFIVLDRLSGDEKEDHEVAQQLVDIMFQDMDDVVRETGVGDMGVGPRIKKLARSFRSRLDYYKLAIEGDGEGGYPRGTLPEAILEVFFKRDKAQLPQAVEMADYVTAGQQKLAKMSLEELGTSKPLMVELRAHKGQGS